MHHAKRSILGFVALLWAGAAFSQPPGRGRFDELDENKDGVLSREELPAAFRDRFAEIDTNKNGSVERPEIAAFLARTKGRPGGSAAQRLRRFNFRIRWQSREISITPEPKTQAGPRPDVAQSPEERPPVAGGGRHSRRRLANRRQIANVGDFPICRQRFLCSGLGRVSTIGRGHLAIADSRLQGRHPLDSRNAARYHLDPDRIGVLGGSAGGHLVSMLGTSAGAESLEGDLGPYNGTSSKVQCVVDQFGPSDLLALGDFPSNVNHNGPFSPGSRLLGGAIQEHKDAARSASPITYVSKDDPPFLIMHGDKDPTVPFDQSERFARALRAAGVDTVFIRVEGGAHGRFQNAEVQKRVRQFFDKHLRDLPVGTISDETIVEVAPVTQPSNPAKRPS